MAVIFATVENIDLPSSLPHAHANQTTDSDAHRISHNYANHGANQTTNFDAHRISHKYANHGANQTTNFDAHRISHNYAHILANFFPNIPKYWTWWVLRTWKYFVKATITS